MKKKWKKRKLQHNQKGRKHEIVKMGENVKQPGKWEKRGIYKMN